VIFVAISSRSDTALIQPIMSKIFIDSSVLFAAGYSYSGHAYDLVKRGLQKQLTLVISEDVRLEVQRNFTNKYPDRLPRIQYFFDNLAFEEAPALTKEDVLAAAAYTVIKDAPIVAAALKAGCRYLATYDRKHLIDPPEVSEQSGLQILTPGDLLEILD